MTGWLPQEAAEATIARLFPAADPFATDPVGWIEQRLGEHLWSKQREIAESVVANRYTAVRSAHSTGKSFLAARLIAWHIGAHPVGDAFAVWTAPTAEQTTAILGRELGKAHDAARLPGRVTLDAKWYLRRGGGEELVAYGRKPHESVAFQGIHARHVLVVVDEASGIEPALWEAIDSLATSATARVLAIGNPTDPASHFRKLFLPGSGWHQIHVDGLESPNFTEETVPPAVGEVLISPEWVGERRAQWGEDSPQWQSRIRGEFPEVSEDTLIAPAWIEAAQHRVLPGLARGRFGVDVSRMGGDETVIYRNRGGVVRLVWAGSKQDTMATAGRVAQTLREQPNVPAVIDAIGVGAGVLDRLHEQGLDVVAFESSGRPANPVRFANRRAECWWRVRELFEQGLIDLDPVDELLAAQLGAVKWELNSSGQILIESKDRLRSRGVRSPDRADAVVMSFWGADWDWTPLSEVDQILQRQRLEGDREHDRVLESSFSSRAAGAIDFQQVKW